MSAVPCSKLYNKTTCEHNPGCFWDESKSTTTRNVCRSKNPGKRGRPAGAGATSKPKPTKKSPKTSPKQTTTGKHSRKALTLGRSWFKDHYSRALDEEQNRAILDEIDALLHDKYTNGQVLTRLKHFNGYEWVPQNEHASQMYVDDVDHKLELLAKELSKASTEFKKLDQSKKITLLNAYMKVKLAEDDSTKAVKYIGRYTELKRAVGVDASKFEIMLGEAVARAFFSKRTIVA